MILQFHDLRIVQQSVVLLRAGKQSIICADDEQRAHPAAARSHHVAHDALIRGTWHHADACAVHALLEQAVKARATNLEFTQYFTELIQQRYQQVPNLRVLLHLGKAFFFLQFLRAGFELLLQLDL